MSSDLPATDAATDAPASRIGLDAAGTALAAGRLLAAFGVASCCALPVALSFLGISAASLVGLGYLAAPHQHTLLYVAVASLGAAAIMMWRRRPAIACASGTACARPVLDWGGRIAFVLAILLLALTFWIEPPV
ncbi:mercuric reductase [Vineibacter terrae]|uniref:Mercuric reductase n=1 Tax=Vineibacter terrae TaxID=2586908 RepID=A0A5C8PSR1_9HYPH|nr:mercuric reductase [Vineibacter terrae]TXL80390.1 mercuric reductase [Vineibacter terrae]